MLGGLYFGAEVLTGRLVAEAFRLVDGHYMPIVVGDDDGLIDVDAVGAGFLLVSRTALATIGRRYAGPQTWFQETVVDGVAVSENLEFCSRATACGFPVRVHCGVTLGHVKSFVVGRPVSAQ